MICLGPGPLRLQNKNKAEEVSALLGAVSDTSTSLLSAALSAALSQQHSGETSDFQTPASRTSALALNPDLAPAVLALLL